ncbi:aerobic carbon-monoxide dehydrogenase medium subunit [Anaerolineales bacterium]|nr:aerobic carbon-monoxide dehydrogenase medium subunit [Anaerolineales bacterium]
MKPAEYLFPATIKDAVQALADGKGEARIIAGGTDLMLDLEKGKIQPRCFVSTDRIQGLDQIALEDDFVLIGAAVTFANLKDHPYINQHLHVLADAARSVGSLSIQNVATLAGNIVNAMPAADGTVSAIALEAEVHVVGIDYEEWRPVESLFLGPGKSSIDPTRQLVTRIRFPRCEHRRGTAWYRIGRRPSLTLPILNCAVNVFLDESGGIITKARIALGPVAPRPFRALEAERFLEGRSPTAENTKQAVEIAQGETNPRGNVLRASREYRISTIPVIVEDALSNAVRRAYA